MLPKVLVVSLLILLVVVLGSIFASFLISSVFFLIRSRNEEKGDEVFKYKRLYMNSLTNVTSSGFVTLHRDIGEEGFVFFRTQSTNEYYLISLFGLDDFKCTGICYCELENRRKSSTTISRNTLYLVSAISSIVAYDKASEYFSSECVKELSGQCSMSSIKSSVDECQEVKEETDGSEEEENMIVEYWCQGRCVPKKYKREETRQTAKYYGCEKLEREGKVFVKYKKNIQILKYAKRYFVRDYLTEYCRRWSTESYLYPVPGTWGVSKWRTLSVCVGANKGTMNPTVECRKV